MSDAEAMAAAIAEDLITAIAAEFDGAVPPIETMPRAAAAGLVAERLIGQLGQRAIKLPLSAQRRLVGDILDRLTPEAAAAVPATPVAATVAAPPREAEPPASPEAQARHTRIEAAKLLIRPAVMEQIDLAAAAASPRDQLVSELQKIIDEVLRAKDIQLNGAEQAALVDGLIDDMLGLGPLEPLLKDAGITDIMVNGPQKVWVERGGKLELSPVTFRDHKHLLNIAHRIVSQIGRRVDESSPMCDARLADGSRVNIIIPPLAIDGAAISIRKFAKKAITLDIMAAQRNLSEAMATVLKIAARSRLNVLISGGTGSGKTTLLNAMSQLIDSGERIVTIEDAAELQLQQPHVVRLETRPANLEGDGEVTIRDLVKNALRMRPDRIILGEIRGAEAIDMLQAMNTGHDGSMCTIHANRPREALTRLENMVALGGVQLPAKAVRTQIASAVNLVVQIARMRDGIRRITNIMEVVGMEGDVVTYQDLFHFEFEGRDGDGRIQGRYVSSGLRPHFLPQAEYFELDDVLLRAMA